MFNWFWDFLGGVGIFIGACFALFVMVKIVAVAIFQAKVDVESRRFDKFNEKVKKHERN